jgi:hypothetical protein
MATVKGNNPLGDEVLALRQEIRDLRDTVAKGGSTASATNPSSIASVNDDDDDTPDLSAKALKQVHAAAEAGLIDGDVLDELCGGGADCPDHGDDDDD